MFCYPFTYAKVEYACYTYYYKESAKVISKLAGANLTQLQQEAVCRLMIKSKELRNLECDIDHFCSFGQDASGAKMTADGARQLLSSALETFHEMQQQTAVVQTLGKISA